MSSLTYRPALRVAPPLLAALLLCHAPDAAANNAPVGGGNACGGVTEPDGTQMVQQAYDDGIYTCGTGSTFVPEALIVGSVDETGATPTCSSTTAGMLYYTGGTIEYCNGTGPSFTSFSSGQSTTDVDIELAAGSAAAPSLTFYSDTNTGLYQASSSGTTINFASDGAEIAAFDSTGDFNLTNAGATSAGAYQINGTTILKLPDTDTTSIAVGKSALAAQSATSSGNTAIGDLALDSITTGTESTAVGYEALYKATGSPNTAIGYGALQYSTTGTNNTATGYKAMSGSSVNNLTGAGYNVAIGNSAISAIQSTGNSNTAIGYKALFSNSIGSDNTAVGSSALNNTTSGGGNVAVGYEALETIATGSNNTALGSYVLFTSSAATSSNTAIGGSALALTTTGSPNSVLGYQGGRYITTGSDNIAIGYEAMYSTSANPLTGTSAGNIAVGDNALISITGVAISNTAVGYNALTSSTVNSTAPNTAIGYNAMEWATTGTNNTALGNKAMTGTSANPLTGNYNTAVGDSALTAITTAAADNTVLGYKAGTAVTGGTDNTLVGWEAGEAVTGSSNIIVGEAHSITSGGSNIVIGNASAQITATSSSQIDIGDTILVEGDHNLAMHGSGTVPTIASGCGSTASAIVGNNNAMVAPWGGTSGSTCTINFNGTWGSTPVCAANSSVSGVSVATTSLSTTALNITLSAAETSGSVYIICLGYK